MLIYKNSNGNSNVESYEIGNEYIDVWFKGSKKVYRYSYKSAGKDNVEEMINLAKSGSGLNSFINRAVKYLYEK